MAVRSYKYVLYFGHKIFSCISFVFSLFLNIKTKILIYSERELNKLQLGVNIFSIFECLVREKLSWIEGLRKPVRNYPKLLYG